MPRVGRGVSMPEELWTLAARAAGAMGLNVSEFVRIAVLEKLERLSILSGHVKDAMRSTKRGVGGGGDIRA